MKVSGMHTRFMVATVIVSITAQIAVYDIVLKAMIPLQATKFNFSLFYCGKENLKLGTTQISSTNPLQFNEIQVVTCRADGGTFTLTFRGKTTERIPFNAKTSELQSYIEAIPTLGPGTTKIITSGGQACVDNKDGTTWTVEFLQDFGSLPLLVPDMRNLLYANALAGFCLHYLKLVPIY